jgi:hypothetical protein
MNASTTDGPARSAIAAAVRTNKAGADDAADAERDEVPRAERTLQAVFAHVLRFPISLSRGFLANRFAMAFAFLFVRCY